MPHKRKPKEPTSTSAAPPLKKRSVQRIADRALLRAVLDLQAPLRERLGVPEPEQSRPHTNSYRSVHDVLECLQEFVNDADQDNNVGNASTSSGSGRWERAATARADPIPDQELRTRPGCGTHQDDAGGLQAEFRELPHIPSTASDIPEDVREERPSDDR